MGIQRFSFKKMHWKMSFVKWRPFCLGLNVLKAAITPSYDVYQSLAGNSGYSVKSNMQNKESTVFFLTLFSHSLPLVTFRKWNSVAPYGVEDFYVSLITKFIGPSWGPSGADRSQVGPMLTPWTLLSGVVSGFQWWDNYWNFPTRNVQKIVWWQCIW